MALLVTTCWGLRNCSRVGMMGREEIQYVPTQRNCDTEPAWANCWQGQPPAQHFEQALTERASNAEVDHQLGQRDVISR